MHPNRGRTVCHQSMGLVTDIEFLVHRTTAQVFPTVSRGTEMVTGLETFVMTTMTTMESRMSL